MPKLVRWEPDFSVRHEQMDAQHRDLLARCNQLAEHCQTDGDASADQRFDQGFAQLREAARAHFEAEATALAQAGENDLEAHRFECEEFEYLVDEIVTTQNFDRLELQRFLALWWVGHVTGMARNGRF